MAAHITGSVDELHDPVVAIARAVEEADKRIAELARAQKRAAIANLADHRTNGRSGAQLFERNGSANGAHDSVNFRRTGRTSAL
jgi:hypothetical protein